MVRVEGNCPISEPGTDGTVIQGCDFRIVYREIFCPHGQITPVQGEGQAFDTDLIQPRRGNRIFDTGFPELQERSVERVGLYIGTPPIIGVVFGYRDRYIVGYILPRSSSITPSPTTFKWGFPGISGYVSMFRVRSFYGESGNKRYLPH